MPARPARLLAWLVALVASAVLARPALAEELIADLSTQTILIASDFSGTNIALFGVVERDAQSVSRGGGYEIAVIVRGPPNDVLVQRKARRFGIWINSEGEHFPKVPSYSALMTTADPGTQLEMLSEAASAPLDGSAAHLSAERAGFYQAYASARAREGLYVREIGGVEMLTDRFFRTLIPLPGVAPDGKYTVDIYLFVGGVLLDKHETSFKVDKVGFEQQLFSLSRNKPLVYGILVVVLALVTGYVGGVVFRRG